MLTLQGKLVVLLLLVLAIVGDVWYIHHLRSDLTDAQTALITEKSNSSTLQAALTSQNGEIASLKAAGDLRLTAAQAALQTAKNQAVPLQTKAKVIYRTAAPASGASCGTELQDTLDLINGVTK